MTASSSTAAHFPVTIGTWIHTYCRSGQWLWCLHSAYCSILQIYLDIYAVSLVSANNSHPHHSDWSSSAADHRIHLLPCCSAAVLQEMEPPRFII